MRRFFTDNIEHNIVKISGGDAHHIANVLRLNCGDIIVACNGKGFDYITKLEEITSSLVCGTVIETAPCVTEPGVRVTLYQGIPKSDKLEYIIQKCVELGIYKIIPVDTERSVAKIEAKKAEVKIQRLNKIALSASKQSGRGIVPTVEMPMSFKNAALEFAKHELPILAYEEEHETTLKQVLKNSKCKDIAVFIGSEGGISPNEYNTLVSLGAQPITLGKRILRTETAPIAILSMIMYEYES